MGIVVIACYRPKPGQEQALDSLMRTHVKTLRSVDLVTDRLPITMRARDGTFVEVFEWRSAEAIESAHGNPVVLKMWDAYAQACDYIPISEVPEAAQMFSSFEPVEIDL